MALIVVSVVGICGFVLPNRDLATAVRVCRFALAVVAAFAGLTGVAAGLLLLILHLGSLRSLDVPYLVLTEPSIIRPRLKKNKKRDPKLDTRDDYKQK